MITVEEVKDILSQRLPEAEIDVEDMTGTMDHIQVRVVWSGFQGKGLIEQHQIVNRALSEALEDGRIHALKIKTSVPK
ncbi:MAG TPA: BolA/IbaG family iron-sulfur metabolism protein [bacterium]|nr:BolA/IbaG family iron-sulfur metabolism protein [bacterium]